MSLAKKIVAGLTALATITMASPAFGLTAEELLAQIQQLQEQLNQLMQQYQQLTGQPAGGGAPAACSGITFDRDLKLGMSGNDVKCLQALLNQDPETKVAESGAGSPGNETTYFGPKTKAAVIKFQEKYRDEILTPVGLTAGTGYVGAKTRAKLNSLLVTPPTPPTPPPAAFEPLTVKVAADTPPAANLQQGTPNNPVLKLVLTGSETETINVSGITLKQYGNLADNYVDNVRLWDENGVQLGSDRTVIGGMVSFVIVPTLSIPAGGSRTITVTVSASSAAPVLTTVQLGVDAASGITGAAFTGNFPVKGNVFTVVPAGQYGSMSLGSYGTLPKYNVKIGEKDVVLNKFIISAGAREDVRLTQITIENTGTAVDTDLTNIRIREVGGSVVGGPVNLSAKKATINLVSGVVITKGTSKKFEVVADIVSGNGRNINLRVAKEKVIGVGVTSGVAIIAGGNDSVGGSVSIGIGSLVVTQSANHPVGSAANFVKSTTAQKLGVFSVKAVGEDILINQVALAFSGVSGVSYLSSVGIYDGDSLVSDLKESVTDTNPKTFSLNLVIPANTTKELTVKGVTYNLTGNPSTITVTWKAGAAGYGLASGEQISVSGDVGLSQVAIYSSGNISVATLDDTKTPFNQGVLSPLAGVLLGALKLRVGREDMKLYSLVLTSDVSSATSSAVAEVALYDTEGNMLSNSVAVSAGKFNIGSEDLLQEVVFPKDTYKTILVKGRVQGTTSAAYYLKIAAGDLTLVGVDSSGNVTNSAEIALGNDTPGQGKYYLSSVVLEMQKDPESPSGNVSRGNNETYAIWDITNPTDRTATITAITLHTKSGFPTAGAAATSTYKLYNESGAQITAVTTTASTANNTITFEGINFVLTPGQTRKISLRIDTSNTSNWPTGSTMQWTVLTVNHVTLAEGYVGYAGNVWSIPADTNLVKLQ